MVQQALAQSGDSVRVRHDVGIKEDECTVCRVVTAGGRRACVPCRRGSGAFREANKADVGERPGKHPRLVARLIVGDDQFIAFGGKGL